MKPLSLKQPKDYVVESIVNEIMTGGIVDNEELVQEEIAKMTGLSRMPVREALSMLENIGMAKRLPNRHVVAVSPTEQRVQTTFAMLIKVETELINQLVDMGRGASVCSTLDKLILEPSGSQELAFHQTLSVMLDVYPLENMHRQLLNGYFRYAVKNLPRNRLQITDFASALKEAVKDSNITLVETLLQSYYAELASAIVKGGSNE